MIIQIPASGTRDPEGGYPPVSSAGYSPENNLLRREQPISELIYGRNSMIIQIPASRTRDPEGGYPPVIRRISGLWISPPDGFSAGFVSWLNS